MSFGVVRQGMSVLVLAPDGIGDLVLRQPLLGALAEAGAVVTVLVQPGHEELVPLIEPSARSWAGTGLSWTRLPAAAELQRFLDGLRAVGWDLVVNAAFDPVRYTDWIVRALPAPAVGFGGGSVQDVAGWAELERELALPARAAESVVRCDTTVHEFEKAGLLAQRLTGQTWTRPRPTLRVPEAAAASARAVVRGCGLTQGRFVACCPAGVKNVTLKAWPVERFADVLVREWRAHGLPALVMGHASEADRVHEVATRVGEAGGRAAVWLGGTGDLQLMAGLLRESGLYLGNDTGAMHVAGAVGAAVVAVSGGGHWPRFTPLAERGAVHTLELPCFGCGWRDCFFGEGVCVAGVPVEDVAASVDDVLSGRASGFALRRAAPPPADRLWEKAIAVHRYRSAVASAVVRTDGAPLVSVVTPCLNGERSIGQTLESVRVQIHPSVEHLVVDGGSTDGTLEILARTPGVSWTSGPDRGMYDAINRGFRGARGEILAYQNSDDRYAGPDAIALAVEAFAMHPDVDVVYGDFRYVDEAGKVLEQVRAPEFALAALRRYNFIPPHSMFVRRRVVHDRGFWLDPDLRFAGDWDWCLRMALGGCRFLHLPEVLSEFRRRPSSLTSTIGFRQKLSEWRVICRRTGTPLLPLVWNETTLGPLRRRLRSAR